MRSAAGPIVLCYHGISDESSHPLLVSPGELQRQLAFLGRRGYRGVTAKALLSGRGRLFHVTFDDAFVNVLNALPILEQFGAPATVFACSGLADDGAPPLPLRDASVPSGTFSTLRWDGLAELIERGVALGSHTVSHPHLTELTSTQLDDELVSSRRRLEDELGFECRLFAYPFGENDRRVRTAAREAGYTCAFGLPGDRSWSDPHNVPRRGIWRKDGYVRFALKVSLSGRSGGRPDGKPELPATSQ